MAGVLYLGDAVAFEIEERYHVDPTHALDHGDRSREVSVVGTVSRLGTNYVSAELDDGRPFMVPWSRARRGE